MAKVSLDPHTDPVHEIKAKGGKIAVKYGRHRKLYSRNVYIPSVTFEVSSMNGQVAITDEKELDFLISVLNKAKSSVFQVDREGQTSC